MLRWLVLLLFIGSCWGQPNPAASSSPVCPSEAVQGRVRLATGSCAWPKQTPVPSSNSLQLVGEQSGRFPVVVLHGAQMAEANPAGPGKSSYNCSKQGSYGVSRQPSWLGYAVSRWHTAYVSRCANQQAVGSMPFGWCKAGAIASVLGAVQDSHPGTQQQFPAVLWQAVTPALGVSAALSHLGPVCACCAVASVAVLGLRLTIKRLVLLNVTVAPSNSSAPKLLPLGLFSTPVTNLSMMDVRFSVAPEIFQQYLEFFSKYILAVRTKTDGGVGMHTVSCFGAGGSCGTGVGRTHCLAGIY